MRVCIYISPGGTPRYPARVCSRLSQSLIISYLAWITEYHYSTLEYTQLKQLRDRRCVRNSSNSGEDGQVDFNGGYRRIGEKAG